MIEKLKARDNTAFEVLVTDYKNSVFTTCYRFLLNEQDAEDVSQEVFIEIFQSIHTFKGNSKLSTWIYRITISKCLDEIKKRNRKKRLSSLGKLLPLESVSNWLSGGTQADDSIHIDENYREIAKILNTLPENQRVAFTLSKMEGFSNAEIAEIMNTTVIAVESLVHRAKKKSAEGLLEILKKN